MTWFSALSKREARRDGIKIAIKQKKDRPPKEFVREVLSSRGWRWLHEAICHDCDKRTSKHPILFLWKHILNGCEPCFDTCHTWDRQVGRDSGNFEHWYRWYLHVWNRQKFCFIREFEDEGYN